MSNKYNTVLRPAFFKHASGEIEIVQVKLQIDPAKDDPRYSGVPNWELTVGYKNKKFQFKKDIKGRTAGVSGPMYVEVTPEPEEILTPSQELIKMEDFAHMQQVQMQEQATVIREQAAIIAGLSNKLAVMQNLQR